MRYFVNTILTTALLAAAAQTYAQSTAIPASSLNPADRAKIEEVVHQYLINKPEVLIEAMQVLQKRQMDQQQQTFKQTQQAASNFGINLFRQPNDPMIGNPSGPITIVEFFDYQCPHCTDMAPVMAAVLKANPNIRIVFKEFPIRGPLSEFAARAALAAHKQGKYYEFSHAMLSSDKPLTQDVILKEIAPKVGLDVNKLTVDMKDANIDKQLKDNAALAQKLKLLGTPALFIGKSDGKGNIIYIPGQASQQQIEEIVKQVK